jgi:hypothetical protein
MASANIGTIRARLASARPSAPKPVTRAIIQLASLLGAVVARSQSSLFPSDHSSLDSHPEPQSHVVQEGSGELCKTLKARA